MKNLKEFVDQLVKIEYLDHCNAFGFYPFQMFVEDKDKKTTISSLDLGGDVRAVYKLFAEQYKENPKRIYLALDFPAGGDITNDFICVIGYEVTTFEIFAIPYNFEIGETLAEIRESEQLNKIQSDLDKFIVSKV